MNALVLGYVLHALACQLDGDVVTHRCLELKPRSAPVSRYVCERAMKVAVERTPAIPPEAFGLSGPHHFTFSCDLAPGGV